MASCARTVEALNRTELQSELRVIMETFAARRLTPAELESVTTEYLALYGTSDCRDRCLENLNINRDWAAAIRKEPRSPNAFLLRHQVIQLTYFSPKQHGSVIQKLLAEPDPILVVDPKTKRLMTASDVDAVTSLWNWANGDGPPRRRVLSEKERRDAASTLRSLVGNGSNAHMPGLWAIGAAYWRALELSWPKLSDSDKSAIRAHVKRPNKSSALPPEPALGRLFALDAGNAKQFRSRLSVAAHSAEIHAMTMSFVGAMRQAIVTQTVISGIQDAVSGR